MRLGIHAPVQGATERFHDVASALGAGVFCWLPACGPHDAARYAGATHLVRLPTPAAGEETAAYVGRVRDLVACWRAVVPRAIFVPGNEPERDAGWDVGAWLVAGPRYAEGLRVVFPNVRLGSVPLTTEQTYLLTRDYATEFDCVTCHAYWEAAHPEDIAHPHLGGAWRHAAAVADGLPVYITEVNSVGRTDPAQIAAWLGSLPEAVAGMCLFLADASPDWATFDVSPRDARAIRALWEGRPLAAAPLPVPETAILPAPLVLPALPVQLPPAPENALWAAICTETADPRERMTMLMGAALETGTITPPWPDQQDGGPGRGPYQIEAARGGSHYGQISEADARDPIRATRFILPDYRAAVRDIGEADWQADPIHTAAEAVCRAERPATRYPEERIRAAWAVIAPFAGDTFAPAPATRFIAPHPGVIVQGSWGTFSHAGRTPGFFAQDFAAAPFSPVVAAADGTVVWDFVGLSGTLPSGMTGRTLILDHADGWRTLYAHLRRVAVREGETVRQGQVIAGAGGDLDQPQPERGSSSGGHLHWELWHDGVRVPAEEYAGIIGPYRQEDDMALPREGKSDAGLREFAWRAARDERGQPVALNPQSGIYARWSELVAAGQPIGIPVTQEQTIADGSGRVVQAFSSGAVLTFVEGRVFVN